MNASDEDLKPKRGYLRRLPPEIESLRDRIVTRFTGEPLSEISAFVQKVLASEKNEVNRIAALAARVVLIRDHVNEVIRLNHPSFLKQTSKADVSEDTSEAPSEHVVMISNENSQLQAGMRRVKIIEDSTVHDVLFPAGITVDVKAEDAERLTSSGKAEYVEVATAEPTDTEASDIIDHEADAETPVAEASETEQEETSGDAAEDAAEDTTEGAAEDADASKSEAETENDAATEPDATDEDNDDDASTESKQEGA
jgi:hypothetical protein